MTRLIGYALALLMLSACQPGSREPNAETANTNTEIPPPHEARDPLDNDGGRRIILGVRGYNYTNRDIASFTVAGSGGHAPSGGSGGISVGGSIPREIPWNLLEFKVRWAADGCMASVTNSYGESREVVRYFYKEKVVRLKQPLPLTPSDLEVHFYPDEHIEILITEFASDPHIPESDIQKDLTPYPPCKEKKQ